MTLRIWHYKWHGTHFRTCIEVISSLQGLFFGWKQHMCFVSSMLLILAVHNRSQIKVGAPTLAYTSASLNWIMAQAHFIASWVKICWNYIFHITWSLTSRGYLGNWNKFAGDFATRLLGVRYGGRANLPNCDTCDASEPCGNNRSVTCESRRTRDVGRGYCGQRRQIFWWFGGTLDGVRGWRRGALLALARKPYGRSTSTLSPRPTFRWLWEGEAIEFADTRSCTIVVRSENHNIWTISKFNFIVKVVTWIHSWQHPSLILAETTKDCVKKHTLFWHVEGCEQKNDSNPSGFFARSMIINLLLYNRLQIVINIWCVLSKNCGSVQKLLGVMELYIIFLERETRGQKKKHFFRKLASFRGLEDEVCVYY